MIQLPQGVWRETVDVFRSCGRGRKECVVYWVGRGSEPGRVDRAVHPKHSATPRHYEVDGEWLTGFWIELGSSGEIVRVQVHTHGRLAGHSPTDEGGAIVYQPGFLSLVLPWFAMEADPRAGAFLADLGEHGEWEEVIVGDRLQWA